MIVLHTPLIVLNFVAQLLGFAHGVCGRCARNNRVRVRVTEAHVTACLAARGVGIRISDIRAEEILSAPIA
jgi:hypothetical protein